MRILLATDGSPWSEAAVEDVCHRSWPPGSEVEVLTVVRPPMPILPDPTMVLAATYCELLERKHDRAVARLRETVAHLKSEHHDLRVSAAVLDGRAKRVIVDEARRWGADLVVLGTHGFGPLKRLLRGSVSRAVARHAPCQVEIVRH
jgi:nucleotide-binding universal stress UspA family protein